jgi:hypothetical protein
MSGALEGKPRESWSFRGEVWTDGDGRAVVVLPPFVRAHRAGFEYELSALGSDSSAVVTEEIVDDRFVIATEEPHVKVAWRVTALRETTFPPDAADVARSSTVDAFSAYYIGGRTSIGRSAH